MTEESQTPPSPDAIREEIERTRAGLRDTVDALAHKVDLKARTQHKATELKGSITDTARHLTASAPPPVQTALHQTSDTSHKAIDRARPYRKQIALAAVTATVLRLIVRRWRRR
jgi:hypothetical protein